MPIGHVFAANHELKAWLYLAAMLLSQVLPIWTNEKASPMTTAYTNRCTGAWAIAFLFVRSSRNWCIKVRMIETESTKDVSSERNKGFRQYMATCCHYRRRIATIVCSKYTQKGIFLQGMLCCKQESPSSVTECAGRV